MKLWMKISAVCTAVLLLIVVAFSALLLMQSRDKILDITAEYAKAKQHDLQSSFAEMANYYLIEDASRAVEYSLVDYCFKKFADTQSVLVKDGETIYSRINFKPETMLDLSVPIEEAAVLQMPVQGRHVLIVGSTATVRNQAYQVFVVQDITPVYQDIDRMVWRFALIAFFGILIGTALIVLLVRRAMRPLKRLGGTTRQIAEGDYAQRAVVASRDEVGTLAEDFNSMAEAVQRRVEELTETAERQRLFIGGVTHEFKTPMTSLLIHSDTLLNTNLSAEEAKTSLAHIHGQVAWLEQLTQKLLKLLALREAPALKRADVCAVLDAAAESSRQMLKERGVTLHVQCAGGELMMDEDLIHSLLVNLIDNAAKASKRGQAVTLRACENTIEVADEGCGISSGEIERVVEPFYMADRSRSKKEGGSGLGLALARQIAQAHGAQLTIESVIGKGTSVKLIFAR